MTSRPESEEEREKAELIREGVTMALYISLSQLAVMMAIPSQQVEEQGNLALTVALTSIGLILAHQVAFRLSTRLVTKGSRLDAIVPRVQGVQLLGGGAVTILAVIPILLFGNAAYRLSMGLLLLFVMIVGYFAARSAPTSRGRSLVYVLALGGIVIAVLAVKSLVSH